eukprot:GILI01003155.1.p1 GENE.GILI01003155.1~~GILI01003155.1.p1  ORF type:complete len:567 (+),score=86.81 GILI01003155.1:158-1858(+)
MDDDASSVMTRSSSREIEGVGRSSPLSTDEFLSPVPVSPLPQHIYSAPVPTPSLISTASKKVKFNQVVPEPCVTPVKLQYDGNTPRPLSSPMSESQGLICKSSSVKSPLSPTSSLQNVLSQKLSTVREVFFFNRSSSVEILAKEFGEKDQIFREYDHPSDMPTVGRTLVISYMASTGLILGGLFIGFLSMLYVSLRNQLWIWASDGRAVWNEELSRTTTVSQLVFACSEAFLLQQCPVTLLTCLLGFSKNYKAYLAGLGFGTLDVLIRVVTYALGLYEETWRRLIIYAVFFFNSANQTAIRVRERRPNVTNKDIFFVFIKIFLPTSLTLFYTIALYLILPVFIEYRVLLSYASPALYFMLNYISRYYACRVDVNHPGKSFLIASIGYACNSVITRFLQVGLSSVEAVCINAAYTSIFNAISRITIYARDHVTYRATRCKNLPHNYYQNPVRRRLLTDLVLSEIVLNCQAIVIAGGYFAAFLIKHKKYSITDACVKSASNVFMIVMWEMLFLGPSFAFNLRIQNLALLRLFREGKVLLHIFLPYFVQFFLILYTNDRIFFMFAGAPT